MEKFHLNAKAVYSVLKDKGITELYHCNTLMTSLTFIEARALLSRGYVEQHELKQTPQRSDAEDVEYNVWDDVFMDGFDIHKKYGTPNKYGPILFVMKLEVLLMPEICPILVTRANPWYWKNYPAWESRYVQTTEEIKELYLTGKIKDSMMMFTFRSPGTSIKLNKFLKEIVIDQPGYKIIKTNRDLGEIVFSKITSALRDNGLGQIPVRFRHAEEKFNWCTCKHQYSQLNLFDRTEFVKRFKV